VTLRRILISSIPLVIALLLQLPSPSNNPKHHAYPKDDQHHTRNNKRSEKPIPVNPKDESDRGTSYYYKRESEQGAKLGFGASEWTAIATGLYAIFAGLTLVAIYLQGRNIIASERAWILIENFGAPPLPNYGDCPPGLEAMSEVTPRIVVTFKVFGKTPARITGVHLRFHIVPTKIGLVPPEPDLPERPVFTDRSGGFLPKDSGFMKAPGQEIPMPIYLEDGTLTRKMCVNIQERTMFLCSYGRVRYRSFGKTYETRFCYIYRVMWQPLIDAATGENLHPSRFMVGGPEAYNRCT
jgi:hypothetical protein